MGKRGPQKGHGGRPVIEIDWRIFEACCKLCATRGEICGVLGIDDNTLDRRVKEKYDLTFGDVLKSFTDNTKISLRRFQLQLAEKNVAMCIWLGKQYLNQRDIQEVKQETTILNSDQYKQEMDELKGMLKELGVNESAITPQSQE